MVNAVLTYQNIPTGYRRSLSGSCKPDTPSSAGSRRVFSRHSIWYLEPPPSAITLPLLCRILSIAARFSVPSVRVIPGSSHRPRVTPVILQRCVFLRFVVRRQRIFRWEERDARAENDGRMDERIFSGRVPGRLFGFWTNPSIVRVSARLVSDSAWVILCWPVVSCLFSWAHERVGPPRGPLDARPPRAPDRYPRLSRDLSRNPRTPLGWDSTVSSVDVIDASTVRQTVDDNRDSYVV